MSTINQCPVFVINLNCAKERMQSMDKQLSNIGVHYERIVAVKGINLTNEQVKNQ